jgi:hypothetical protein
LHHVFSPAQSAKSIAFALCFCQHTRQTPLPLLCVCSSTHGNHLVDHEVPRSIVMTLELHVQSVVSVDYFSKG